MTAEFKTYEEYKASGALDPVDLADDWLVRTKDGREMSTHKDREDADRMALRIGGTVERHHPNQSTYWEPGADHYDH